MATAELEVPITEQPPAVENSKLAEKLVKEKKPEAPKKKTKVPKTKKNRCPSSLFSDD